MATSEKETTMTTELTDAVALLRQAVNGLSDAVTTLESGDYKNGKRALERAVIKFGLSNVTFRRALEQKLLSALEAGA